MDSFIDFLVNLAIIVLICTIILCFVVLCVAYVGLII